MRLFNSANGLLYILIALSCLSCSDLLDKEPLDIINDEKVWSDPNLIKADLIQLYNDAPTRRLFNWGFSMWGYEWDDGVKEPAREPGNYVVISDEAVGSYAWVESRQLNKEGISRNNEFMKYWDYTLIRNCNEFIEKIETANVSEDKKEVFKAEARFIRAFIYFEKVKRYGGVPIITVPQSIDDPEEELYPKRNTEKEVYDFVISECKEIANILLLPNAIEKGRASKFAALALLSRAALYAGSIAEYGTVELDGLVGISDNPSTYYQISYDASQQIIQEGSFSLFNKYDDKATNYQRLFLDDDNPEIIFEREFLGLSKGHNFDYFNIIQGYGAGWGSYLNPTLEIVEAYHNIDGSDGEIDWDKADKPMTELFKDKDPRLFGTFYFDGSELDGKTVETYIIEADFGNGVELQDKEPNAWHDWTIDGETVSLKNTGNDSYSSARANATKSGFYIKKFIDVDNLRSALNQTATDWIEFRLGEIILNKAEAAFKLSKTSEALDCLNQIRDRAGVAPLTVVNMDKIINERQVELAFETHRLWDMRRWRIANKVMNNVFHGVTPIRKMPDNTYRYVKYCCDCREDGFDKEVARYFNPLRMYYLPFGESICNNNPNIKENPNYAE